MPDRDQRDEIQRERIFALVLGAIVRQDVTGDVELAWRVAEWFMTATDRRDPPDIADQP